MRSSANGSGGSHTRKPYQPAVGREIEIDEVPAIDAKTRGFPARFIATSVAVAVAVAVSGAEAFMTGRYAALEIVWAIAGPLVGAVVAFYFGAHWSDTR